MSVYYVEQETIDKAEKNYRQAMQDVQEAIKNNSKDLKDKIAYMRFLGDTYRAYIRAGL